MKVLLGVCDLEIGSDAEVDWSTTKVGGLPNLITPQAAQWEWPKCQLCQQSCTFLAQVYCPIGGSPFHRTLYIFACRNKPCWNKRESWCVIRGQQLDEKNEPETKPKEAEDPIDWGCDAGDWADDDDWGEDTGEEDLSSKLDHMTLSPPSNDLPTKNAGPSVTSTNRMTAVVDVPEDVRNHLVVSRYVAVVEETSEKEDSPFNHESKLMKEYARQEGIDLKSLLECDSMDTEGGGGKEKYEKSSVHHGDAVFQKFKKRTLRYPQQVLRYEFGGQPLNMKKPVVESIPPCAHCGQPRIFEVQLMPALLNYLRFPGNSEEVIDFGTVQIFTCKESCWSDDATRTEFVIVQDDPDQHLFS